MNLITALEIATNYPDHILIEAHQSIDTNKWRSVMYMLRGDYIHKKMLSYDNFPFESEEKAISEMEIIAKRAIEFIDKNAKPIHRKSYLGNEKIH